MKKIISYLLFVSFLQLAVGGCGGSEPKKQKDNDKKDNYGTVPRKNGPKIDKPGEWNKSELAKDSGESATPRKPSTGTRPTPVPIDNSKTKTTPVTPTGTEKEAYKSKEWVFDLLPPYGSITANLVINGKKNVVIDPEKNLYRVSAEYTGKKDDRKEQHGDKEMSFDYSVFRFDIFAKRVTFKQGMEALKENGDIGELIKDVKCSTTVGRGLLQITWLHGNWLFSMSMKTDETDIDDEDFERVGKSIANKIAEAVAGKDKKKGYLKQ